MPRFAFRYRVKTFLDEVALKPGAFARLPCDASARHGQVFANAASYTK